MIYELDIMMDFTMEGISDIASIRNKEGTIMPQKPVNFYFPWPKGT